MSAGPRRMRSQTVLLGVTALAASSLSGCASEPEYAAICTDPQTHQRVDDDQCDDSDRPRDYSPGLGGFFWFYMLTSSTHRIPAIGQSYSPRIGTYNGSRLTGTGRTVQRGGLPRTGGTSVKSFTRSGGFGTSRGISSS
jgi:hypothetical protein